MDQLNLNLILDREKEENLLINTLQNFELNKSDKLTKRGIYIYGNPGAGKSIFVKNILKKLNYDIILYDAGDIRNKSIIENITKHNMSDKNVLSLFQKKKKNIAIIMDEIDGMNNGDKGGITALIKLIRPKKTKKQKKEATTMIPIICIGNYHTDKKIKELTKVSIPIEIKKPEDKQIINIINILIPNIDITLKENVVKFIQGDLRKLQHIYDIYKNQECVLKNKVIHNIFQQKNYNEDVKDIIKKLLNNKYTINDHIRIMNDTDRTSVALLYHENLVDVIKHIDKKNSIPFYNDILENICFSDYIDRITFQKQIWIFNEMSSLVKTFYNNYLYNEYIGEKKKEFNPKDVRFTKVLTKYSTEYNNSLFIQNLCKQFSMDKSDIISFFFYLKKNNTTEEIITLFQNENYEITKLDINRMYRFIDRIYNNDLDI
mgnify:CR=1 FL=1